MNPEKYKDEFFKNVSCDYYAFLYDAVPISFLEYFGNLNNLFDTKKDYEGKTIGWNWTPHQTDAGQRGFTPEQGDEAVDRLRQFLPAPKKTSDFVIPLPISLRKYFKERVKPDVDQADNDISYVDKYGRFSPIWIADKYFKEAGLYSEDLDGSHTGIKGYNLFMFNRENAYLINKIGITLPKGGEASGKGVDVLRYFSYYPKSKEIEEEYNERLTKINERLTKISEDVYKKLRERSEIFTKVRPNETDTTDAHEQPDDKNKKTLIDKFDGSYSALGVIRANVWPNDDSHNNILLNDLHFECKKPDFQITYNFIAANITLGAFLEQPENCVRIKARID